MTWRKLWRIGSSMSAMRSTPANWIPSAIAGAIKPFTPGTQLARVFRYHQEIQDARGMTVAASPY